MNPKMTVEDAARILGKSQAALYAELKSRHLDFASIDNSFYLGHQTARELFQFSFKPKVVVFQILKGGTGKTSIAFEFAVRASLYGAKVLCIDLDQQANLTQAFNQNAEIVPVMVDSLADGYSLMDSFLSASEGIDLIPSRIENALLDEVIRSKAFALEKVYRNPLQILKKSYDLIVVDCPPSLGQSVAAAALAADLLIAPVTAEKFALSGLKATNQSIEELQTEFGIEIPFNIILNKFDPENSQSVDTFTGLAEHPDYQHRVLDTYIRLSHSIPSAALKSESIFESIAADVAKDDIDQFTRLILDLHKPIPEPVNMATGLGYSLERKQTLAFC